MSERARVLDELRAAGAPVVICGAGVVGEVLLGVCRDEGIEVACFCDSSVKVAGTTFCGLEVLYTPDLGQRFDDAALLISVASIKDVVQLLERSGFARWWAGGLLLEDLDVDQGGDDPALDYTKFAMENAILCHRGYLDPARLFLRSVDLIITERCSLTCRGCSNLTQYYAKPQNVSINELQRDIDAFCRVVDEVMDFRILGGDALMNRQWHQVVQRMCDEPAARRVVLYTNGVLMPHDAGVPALRHPKVLVVVTDYGHLSRRLAELRRLLQDERVAHHVLQVDDWLDCSEIGRAHV